jgi:hypothetical protein
VVEVMQCDQFIGNCYLHCSTLCPTQVARLRLQPLGRHSRKAYRHRSLGGNDGRRPRRRTPHAANNTLLGLINKNTTAVRHLRVTHSRFSNLKESKEAVNEEGELALPGPSATLGGPLDTLDYSGAPILTDLEPLSNINPWSQRLDEDCDVGPQDAEKCLHWMGERVLEYAGFQGRYLVWHAIRQCLHFSYRDVGDRFRCAYWCCFGVFIERRPYDTIPIGQVWKQGICRGASRTCVVGFHGSITLIVSLRKLFYIHCT